MVADMFATTYDSAKRVKWIDTVKGFGILLVVLEHVYRYNAVSVWITSFHMPMFFILSGWIRGGNQQHLIRNT